MSELIYPLRGGISAPEHKRQSSELPIKTLPLSAFYQISLQLSGNRIALPAVSVGEKVLKNQLIAKDERPFGSPLHAPTSGVILTIAPEHIAHESGQKALAITLESDGLDEAIPTQPILFQNLTENELLKVISRGGIVGLGGAGFPSAVKMSRSNQTKIHTLIVNGAECESYMTADDRLMREQPHLIVEGIGVICHLVKPTTIRIGIEDNKPEAIAAMKQVMAGHTEQVVAIPTRYPSGDASQLIRLLTGIEVPADQRAVDSGILCFNVGTLAAIGHLMNTGQPLIDRIITVTGQAVTTPCNLRVRNGTPIRQLLDFCNWNTEQLDRVIVGGPLMGFAINSIDIATTKTTNCVIAATADEFGPPQPEMPCIRCGFCADVCPVNLLPQQLYWHAKAEQTAGLISHHLDDCMKCGACAYVCPSSIPLVQYFKAAQGRIRAQKQKKEKSDRARLRFEERNERIKQLQEEKAAKRKASLQKSQVLKIAAITSDKTELSAKNKEMIAAAMTRTQQADSDKKKAAVTNRTHLQVKAIERQLVKIDKNLQMSAEKADVTRLSSQLTKLRQQKEKLLSQQSVSANNTSSVVDKL